MWSGGEGVGGGCLNDGIFKRKFSNPFPFFPFLVRCDTSEEVLSEVVYVVMEKVGAFDVMRPYATPACPVPPQFRFPVCFLSLL